MNEYTEFNLTKIGQDFFICPLCNEKEKQFSIFQQDRGFALCCSCQNLINDPKDTINNNIHESLKYNSNDIRKNLYIDFTYDSSKVYYQYLTY